MHVDRGVVAGGKAGHGGQVLRRHGVGRVRRDDWSPARPGRVVHQPLLGRLQPLLPRPALWARDVQDQLAGLQPHARFVSTRGPRTVEEVHIERSGHARQQALHRGGTRRQPDPVDREHPLLGRHDHPQEVLQVTVVRVAPEHRHPKVRVGVHQSRQERVAGKVHDLGARVCSQHLVGRADPSDRSVEEGHGAVHEHTVLCVHREDPAGPHHCRRPCCWHWDRMAR